MEQLSNKGFKSMAIILIATNTLVYISSSLYAPFLGAYYTERGVTASEIGILMAIGPLIAILIQPLWAGLSDRTGRRKDVLSLIILGCAISINSYYLGNNFFGYFIATILFTIFSTSMVPLSDAILVDLSEKIKFKFSYVRLGGTLGYALTVYIAGRVLKYYPSALFAMASISYLIMMFVVRRLPSKERENSLGGSGQKPLDIEEVEEARHEKRTKRERSRIFMNNDIVFVLLFAFVTHLGLYFGIGFMGVYLIELGYDQSIIGMLNTISALSEVPILLCIHKLIKRFGTMRIIAFSGIMAGVRILLISGGSLPTIIISQMLQSVTYMTTYYCSVTYINQNVEPMHRSKGQGILTITQAGLGSIMGMILGGRVIEAIGMRQSYIVVGCVIVGVSFVTILIYIIYNKLRSRNLINEMENIK
ncbi:MAG: MFS transporter [Clostridiales bacterium]|nr:MFS transporter [Clostridiales bacterium]